MYLIRKGDSNITVSDINFVSGKKFKNLRNLQWTNLRVSKIYYKSYIKSQQTDFCREEKDFTDHTDIDSSFCERVINYYVQCFHFSNIFTYFVFQICKQMLPIIRMTVRCIHPKIIKKNTKYKLTNGNI